MATGTSHRKDKKITVGEIISPTLCPNDLFMPGVKSGNGRGRKW